MKEIEEMYYLQDMINTKMCGEHWIEGLSDDGKAIKWNKCVFMESASALNTFSWEHWKEKELVNQKFALTSSVLNIWHYLISWDIAKHGSIEKALKNFIEEKECFSETMKNNEISVEDALETVMTSSLTNEIPYKPFFVLIDAMDEMSFGDLYSLYVGKFCIDTFRQNFELRNENYSHIWKGKEDYTYMLSFIKDNDNISIDEMYEHLSIEYEKAMHV